MSHLRSDLTARLSDTPLIIFHRAENMVEGIIASSQAAPKPALIVHVPGMGLEAQIVKNMPEAANS